MQVFDRRTILQLLLAVLASGTGGLSGAEDAPSNFKAVYSDAKLRKRFYLFLQNVFHLYPEDPFHRLIVDVSSHHDSDDEIYRTLQKRLPEIKPLFSELTYAVPALAKQKAEMARETAELLGRVRAVKGYVEIGTPGRYVKALRR